MAAQMRELKSILKPSRSSHVAQGQKTREEAEQIALAHARIIQQQKDLELQILDAIDTLATYPPSLRSSSSQPTSPTSSLPSAEDISSFKSLLRPFQPSDYDDLIAERNIHGHCGYALCPKPRRPPSTLGRFKLVNHNRRDFAIVKTDDVVKWCSDLCARRALYVKVQLSETAAWERVAVDGVPIELLEEDEGAEGRGGKEEGDTGLESEVARLKLEGERKSRGDKAALSLERGDVLERGGGDDGKERRRVPLAPKMELSIREKDVKGVAKPPRLEDAEEGGGTIEGYSTRFGAREEESDEDEGEDVDDSGYEGSRG